MKTQLFVSLLGVFIAKSVFAIQTQYLPDGFCPKVVDYSYYSLCYVSEHRQAAWVKYKLTEKMINGKQKRTNNFRMDPSLDDPVTKTDYRGSGFDRGHLLPAADMKLNYQSMSETFYMTNMSPQKPRFNQRIWLSLEVRMRNLVRWHGEAHVVTAGILEPNLPMIKTGVSVPRWFYKVAYFPGPQIMKAFLIENKGYEKGTYFSDFLVSVDEVEAVTGFDFFSELPDMVESQLESTVFRE